MAYADKVFAHSKSLNMSFTAIGTPWCQSNVNMQITANDIDKFDTTKFYTILKKLSHVLAQECPKVNIISLHSQAANNYSIWRGHAKKSDGWNIHRTGTRKLKRNETVLNNTEKQTINISKKALENNNNISIASSVTVTKPDKQVPKSIMKSSGSKVTNSQSISTFVQWEPLIEGSDLKKNVKYKFHPRSMKLSNKMLLRSKTWNDFLKEYIETFSLEQRDDILKGLTRFWLKYDKVNKYINFSPLKYSSGPYAKNSYVSLDGRFTDVKANANLIIRYFGKSPIFANKITVAAGDFIWETSSAERHFFSDQSSKAALEYIVLELSNPKYRDIADKIISPNKVIIQFNGKHNYELTVTERMKQDISAMLKAIDAVNGINKNNQSKNTNITTTSSANTVKTNSEVSEYVMDQLAGGWKGELFGKPIELVTWPHQIKSNSAWSLYHGYMYSPYYDCFMSLHLNYKNNETLASFTDGLGLAENERAGNCKKNLLNKKDFRGEGEFVLSSNKQELDIEFYFLYFDDFKLKAPEKVKLSLKRNPTSSELIFFLKTHKHNYIKKPSPSLLTFLKSGDIPEKKLKIDSSMSLQSPSGYYWIGKSFNEIKASGDQFNLYNVIKTKYFKEDEITARAWWDPKSQQLKYQNYAKKPGMERCNSWAKLNWSYQFIPTTIDINGRATIVYQDNGTYADNKRPGRQCVHAGFNKFTCKQVRCNKWETPKSGTFLVKSRKDAMELYSQIKSR